MTTAEKTLWREALTNHDHELCQAAWLIFKENVQLNNVQLHLHDQKEATKPLLLEIIDDDYLYDPDSPGGGQAPLRAIELIGQWQVDEALPSLLDILVASAGHSDKAYDVTVDAIGELSPAVLDDALAWAKEKPEFSLEAAQFLTSLAKGSENAEQQAAVFAWLTDWIEQEDEDFEVYVDYLSSLDETKAADYLEAASENDQFTKDGRKYLRREARQIRKMLKEKLEAELAAQAMAADQAEDDDTDEGAEDDANAFATLVDATSEADTAAPSEEQPDTEQTDDEPSE